MTDPNETPEFTAALREHFAHEVERARFQPISAAGIRRTAAQPAPRRGVRWLALAAALAVLVPAGIVVAQLLTRPVTAVPAPTVAASPSTAAPAPSRPSVAGWFRRVTAPAAVGGHAQASVGDAVYLIAAQPGGGSCRLLGYRYDPAIDLWQGLPEGPAYRAEKCANPLAVTSGKGVDVLVAEDEPRLYRYEPAASAWTNLDFPADAEACAPVGMDAGVFCLQPADAAGVLGYQFHDASGWRSGIVNLGLGEPPEAVSAHRVELAGSEAVLLVAAKPGGDLVAAVWDPATRRLSPPASHPGVGGESVQLTSDGFAVFAAEASDAALVLNLAAGVWSSVEAPLPGGPLTSEQPSDADWVVRAVPEAADRVVLGGYLYRPADGSWAAVSGLPRPEAGAAGHDWVGVTGVCRQVSPFNCWGLSVGALTELLTAVDPAAIAASNDQVR